MAERGGTRGGFGTRGGGKWIDVIGHRIFIFCLGRGGEGGRGGFRGEGGEGREGRGRGEGTSTQLLPNFPLYPFILQVVVVAVDVAVDDVEKKIQLNNGYQWPN